MDFPRVTEILRPFTSYDQVPQKILSKAAARGTSVHATCAGIARGAWIPESMVNPEYIGYIKSFQQWANDQVKDFLIIEKRYATETLRYSGQLDFVIKGHDEKLYLVDLKTSARPQKTYPLQMAAYDFLLKNADLQIHGAMIVYLDKDGEYPNIHFLEDLSEEFHIFKSALDCWHYFNKGKLNGRKTKST